jgi:hypothetical protein
MEEYNWQEVQSESVDGDFIKFDAIGQQAIGVLTKLVKRDGKFGPETVLAMESVDGREVFNITAPYDLREKIAKVTPGNIVRITYVSDKAMGGDKNPMKVFKVETAPRPAKRSVVPVAAAASDAVPF